MKLAEALNLRADTQKYIRQIENRLLSNARIQEGDEPAEAPESLLEELNTSVEALSDLVFRINKTNYSTICNEKPLTEILASRDALALKNSVLSSFLNKAGDSYDRYTRTELRSLSTIDVTTLHKKVNENAKMIRELDNNIQRLNWETDLL